MLVLGLYLKVENRIKYSCSYFNYSRRFTKTFAQLAKSVVAVDFMESFLEKNKQENSHYGTVEFLHKDATQLSFEPYR